ncbi:unnamed protein product, partial [Diplocarpon coronariae]
MKCAVLAVAAFAMTALAQVESLPACG